MSQLDAIKARAEDALLHENLDPSVYAELAWKTVSDVPKLVAALEAVEGMTGKLLDSSDSPPGQDDFNKGIDQGFAIAAKAIRSALEEALS